MRDSPDKPNKTKYEPVSADDGMRERFIATATAVNSPTTEAQPYLEVVAPAILPEVCRISVIACILAIALVVLNFKLNPHPTWTSIYTQRGTHLRQSQTGPSLR